MKITEIFSTKRKALVFKPKDDITMGELVQVVSIVFNGDRVHGFYVDWPENIKRHFVVEQRG